MTQIKIWLGAIAAGLVFLLTFGRVRFLKGAANQRAKTERNDRAKASEIRDRVERDLPGSVRDFDSAGWRDTE